MLDRVAPGAVALLIVDMINAFEFEGGEDLLPKAARTADAILGLRDAADDCGAPVIYVNDNYGRWHADRDKIVAACQSAGGEAADIVKRIAPRERDLFVVKPQVSGFYATNLPVLLPKLGVSRIVLTGVAADICILFTAADAHMRDYEIWAPKNAVASEDERRTDWALDIMRKSMDAETRPTDELTLADWIGLRRDRDLR
jgi:nicotinamidase-related amidase